MRYEYFVSYGDVFTYEKLSAPSLVDFNEISNDLKGVPNRALFNVYIVGGVAEGIEGTKDIDINITPVDEVFDWNLVLPFLLEITRYFVIKKKWICDVIFFDDISFIQDWTKVSENVNKVGYVGYSHRLEIVGGKVVRFIDLSGLDLWCGLRVCSFQYPSVKNITRNYRGKKVLL